MLLKIVSASRENPNLQVSLAQGVTNLNQKLQIN